MLSLTACVLCGELAKCKRLAVIYCNTGTALLAPDGAPRLHATSRLTDRSEARRRLASATRHLNLSFGTHCRLRGLGKSWLRHQATRKRWKRLGCAGTLRSSGTGWDALGSWCLLGLLGSGWETGIWDHQEAVLTAGNLWDRACIITLQQAATHHHMRTCFHRAASCCISCVTRTRVQWLNAYLPAWELLCNSFRRATLASLLVLAPAPPCSGRSWPKVCTSIHSYTALRGNSRPMGTAQLQRKDDFGPCGFRWLTLKRITVSQHICVFCVSQIFDLVLI